ncbi:MAG: GNAT family N-acetyltransferase [Ilumatobacter sp.]
MNTQLRSRLAHSEAAATRLLAQSMFDQGNTLAVSEVWDVGSVVSLGPGRFVNRLLCHQDTLDVDHIDATIEFFTSRKLAPSIQITSRAPSAIVDRLAQRGFTVDWERVVLAGPAAESRGFHSTLSPTIATVRDDDLDDWLDVLARGNGANDAEQRERSNEHARAASGVHGSIDLLASVDGCPAACGSLQPVDGVAWVGGAATLPEFREQGLQRALLDVRVDIAGLDGQEFVAATALPDSTSSRNLQRADLSLVDHQTVWTCQH